MVYEDKERKRKYDKKRSQLPEVKAKKKEYNKEYQKKNKDKISEQKKEHYQNNKKKIKEQRQKPDVRLRKNEYAKKYRKKNKDKVVKQHKEYRENNKEYFKEYSKEYNIKNKERITKQHKEYRENNKEYFKEYSKEHHQKLVIKENKRRKKLGLPLVGEGWISECEMFSILKKIIKSPMIKHDRKVLDGLELDAYFLELKLAFEYNGIQHYQWIPFFHKTKEEFEAQQYRDKCTKKVCKLLGINLITIKYNEKLSEQLVLSKLKHFNFPIVQSKT